jgi:hypothetical protein
MTMVSAIAWAGYSQTTSKRPGRVSGHTRPGRTGLMDVISNATSAGFAPRFKTGRTAGGTDGRGDAGRRTSGCAVLVLVGPDADGP